MPLLLLLLLLVVVFFFNFFVLLLFLLLIRVRGFLFVPPFSDVLDSNDDDLESPPDEY